MSKEQQFCDRGRLNIRSVDHRGHGVTLCVLPRGHTGDHAMAKSVQAFHSAQGSDLGPWQPLAEMNDLANEVRDRRGVPRVDYGLDSEGRPRRDALIGQADSFDEAVASLHEIGKN